MRRFIQATEHMLNNLHAPDKVPTLNFNYTTIRASVMKHWLAAAQAVGTQVLDSHAGEILTTALMDKIKQELYTKLMALDWIPNSTFIDGPVSRQ